MKLQKSLLLSKMNRLGNNGNLSNSDNGLLHTDKKIQELQSIDEECLMKYR